MKFCEIEKLSYQTRICFKTNSVTSNPHGTFVKYSGEMIRPLRFSSTKMSTKDVNFRPVSKLKFEIVFNGYMISK